MSALAMQIFLTAAELPRGSRVLVAVDWQLGLHVSMCQVEQFFRISQESNFGAKSLFVSGVRFVFTHIGGLLTGTPYDASIMVVSSLMTRLERDIAEEYAKVNIQYRLQPGKKVMILEV